MRLPTPQQLREEMKILVRRAAEPARSGESVKAEISRAARVLGLSHGRVKRYWYGEIQVPPAHEVDAVRAAMAARQGSPKMEAAQPPAADPASQLHILYDEDGRVWPAGSPELRESLGYTVGDFDVPGFAVRCLGWVEIRHVPAKLHIRIAPRVAQPKAVDAAFRVLAATGQVEVVLTVRAGQAWEEESHVSASIAAGRIDALIRGPEARTGSRFIAIRQPVSVLFRDKQHYLIGMLQEARSLLASEDRDAAIRFAAADETGRTSVAVGTARPGERPQWRWEHIGSALRFYTAEERERIIGSDIRLAPDAEYGEWCADAYDRAIAGGEPVIEDVRALVLRRSAAPIDVHYRRLLMPFSAGNGQRVVLVTGNLIPQRRAA